MLRTFATESSTSIVALQEGITFLVSGGGLHYRALAIEDLGELAWFWIGSHAEYDKLLGRG